MLGRSPVTTALSTYSRMLPKIQRVAVNGLRERRGEGREAS